MQLSTTQTQTQIRTGQTLTRAHQIETDTHPDAAANPATYAEQTHTRRHTDTHIDTHTDTHAFAQFHQKMTLSPEDAF